MTAVVDVTEASFQTDVLDRSFAGPVVVDFWAAWCGPCRTLGPVLERLAGEAGGGWTLAKVDVDRNPRLASAAGVQGIPAVRAFKNGRQVAEFTGALPEAQVRAWLAQLGPSEADRVLDDARTSEERDDLGAAAEGYRRVLSLEPANAHARSGLARMELAQRSRGAEEGGLRDRVEADPGDVEAAALLADVLFARGRVEEAFAVLLDAIRKTSEEKRDLARRRLLQLIDVRPDDPRAARARRELSLVLF